MSIQQRPVSELIRGSDLPDDEPKKRSREDFKKEKELEELRKAGTVPALVDEDGKDINPHIPQYISSTPWYYGSSGPTLKHQRPQDDKTSKVAKVDEWYPRGLTNKIATKFRPGACENCGAMGHNKKSCFEKPRKVPAKVSGIVIAPDDTKLPELNLDYDSKRDRWNGYDPKMYKAVVEEYNKLEEAKKILKEEKLKEELVEKEVTESREKADSDSDSDEEDKYADHIDMPGTKVDSKQRITVRNLRIREDTAKYLRNLDPDSAYYDPKTRSMRDNPYKNTSKNPTDLPYAGENYVRYSGDTVKVSQIQLFAWQARDKGADIHLQAEPTKAEIIHKEYQTQKTKLKSSIKQSILEKYGGEEYLQSPPAELVYGQSERYIEYYRDGKPKIEPPKTIIRSKYEEDVYPNNHTSVWGSYYNVKTSKWGYKCCHATVKNAYCVGSAGISTDDLIKENLIANIDKVKRDKETSSPTTTTPKEIESSTSKKQLAEESTNDNEGKLIVSKQRWSELGHKKRKRGNNLFPVEDDDLMDDRKRPYNSMNTFSSEPTEEEIEEYRKQKEYEDDPMYKYMNKK